MTGILLDDFDLLVDVRKDELGLISRGLTTGDTLRQNQAVILAMHQGEMKEHPMTGAGIGDMMLDNDPLYWRTRIKEQLEMDGQRVDSVKVTRNGIIIDAKY